MDIAAPTEPEVQALPAPSKRIVLATSALPMPEVQPVVELWPTAGKVLGLGRSSTYAAAERGEIPTIRLGGRIVVPTAALRKMLHLDQPVAV